VPEASQVAHSSDRVDGMEAQHASPGDGSDVYVEGAANRGTSSIEDASQGNFIIRFSSYHMVAELEQRIQQVGMRRSATASMHILSCTLPCLQHWVKFLKMQMIFVRPCVEHASKTNVYLNMNITTTNPACSACLAKAVCTGSLLQGLNHLQGQWKWVDRVNKAVQFPSDFALLAVSRPKLGQVQQALKQVPGFRDIHPDKAIRGALKWQPEGPLAAAFSDTALPAGQVNPARLRLRREGQHHQLRHLQTGSNLQQGSSSPAVGTPTAPSPVPQQEQQQGQQQPGAAADQPGGQPLPNPWAPQGTATGV